METDKLVAASLQELPHSDRGDVLDDIHGVSQVIEESSTFLKERLLAFDRIINGKKRNRLNWRAYNIAESISKEYVENPAFRLQFLRSTSFDGDKAADRLADHFEEKLELFGESKLAKKISIEDMNSAAAMEGLRSGYLQRFPSRDSAGRAVFCVYRALRPESLDVLSRRRILWYMTMKTAEDEETQKKGIVYVWYCIGKQSYSFEREKSATLIRMLRAVPIRLVAAHICYNDTSLSHLLTLGASILEHTMRVRIRFYFGSCLEVTYALLTHGIPKIVRADGVVDLSAHLRWLDEMMARETNGIQLAVEASRSLHNGLFEPGPKDILLGKGRNIENSPGNLRFRRLIAQFHDQYNRLCRFERTTFATTMLISVKNSGGRFYKKSSSSSSSNRQEVWEEVDDDVARDKITHAFRNYRTKLARERTEQERPPPSTQAPCFASNPCFPANPLFGAS